MKQVNYISNAFDSSGYANAALNNIAALNHVEVPIDVTAITFEKFRSDTGIIGKEVSKLIKDDSVAPIQIIHATPPTFDRFRSSRKYNIGYTTWETNELPIGWKDSINSMDEIWVPCTQNKKIFEDSGITKPIHVIPHTFNSEIFDKESIQLDLQNVSDDEFRFYSVFQWTERKNPLALLKAYLTEFSPDEKVCLVLKTYLQDPTNGMEVHKIKQMIGEIKDKLYLKNYPKMVLISELLSRGQINSIHKQMDCYLSFHRNEGFGIPIAEAMMGNKPVIATNYGGPLDFLEHERNSLLCNHQLTPCYGMPWNTYNGKMSWADIDIFDARKMMRKLFNDRDLSKQLGVNGATDINNKYSWNTVGNLMKQRLESV